jgi:arsenite methyltransferase
MDTPKLLQTLIVELLGRNRVARIPEPDLVMDNPESVRAFAQYGNFKTPLGMSYLLYAAHICEVIRQGDLVLDLGCGPGNLLLFVAQLNPRAQFIGLDLSDVMLGHAQKESQRLGIKNVRFLKGDMTNLRPFHQKSVDVCISSLAIHHLPSSEHLQNMFKEIARVLRPGGGLFLTDYGRLKREGSMHFVAHKYRERQPQLLTEDYFNSLKASFSLQEIEDCYKSTLKGLGDLRVTPILPIAISIKSLPRRPAEDWNYQATLKSMVGELDPDLQKDFYLLLKLFRWGQLVDHCF